MREAELLALTGQDHGVLTGIAPGSDSVHSDLVWIPSTRSLAPMPHTAVEISATGSGYCSRQRKGGPGRRIHFVPVVHFDDLDIVPLQGTNE